MRVIAFIPEVYWRFDFDIEGAPNDLLERFLFFIFWADWDAVKTEVSQPRSLVGFVWRVRDKVTGRGYRVVPGSDNGIADSFAVADNWALRYWGTEIDDGGSTSSAMGDAAHMDNYVNGENIDGQDACCGTAPATGTRAV